MDRTLVSLAQLLDHYGYLQPRTRRAPNSAMTESHLLRVKRAGRPVWSVAGGARCRENAEVTWCWW
ncbi:hypothetical protein [Kibdelosporangium philippinense]|uniref:hypothetical protein n=1 Tax=Kibdelosporangium philippinense TaxID=211113 RepID=UPI003609E1E5